MELQIQTSSAPAKRPGWGLAHLSILLAIAGVFLAFTFRVMASSQPAGESSLPLVGLVALILCEVVAIGMAAVALSRAQQPGASQAQLPAIIGLVVSGGLLTLVALGAIVVWQLNAREPDKSAAHPTAKGPGKINPGKLTP